jgi:hypothetical protein
LQLKAKFESKSLKAADHILVSRAELDGTAWFSGADLGHATWCHKIAF